MQYISANVFTGLIIFRPRCSYTKLTDFLLSGLTVIFLQKQNFSMLSGPNTLNFFSSFSGKWRRFLRCSIVYIRVFHSFPLQYYTISLCKSFTFYFQFFLKVSLSSVKKFWFYRCSGIYVVLVRCNEYPSRQSSLFCTRQSSAYVICLPDIRLSKRPDSWPNPAETV